MGAAEETTRGATVNKYHDAIALVAREDAKIICRIVLLAEQ
jgi:hypothetical protein